MISSHYIGSNKCPRCGRELDGATSAENEDRRPEPGDLSVCAYCGAYLQFNEHLKSQLLSAEEFVDLPVDVRATLQQAQQAVLEMKKRGP